MSVTARPPLNRSRVRLAVVPLLCLAVAAVYGMLVVGGDRSPSQFEPAAPPATAEPSLEIVRIANYPRATTLTLTPAANRPAGGVELCQWELPASEHHVPTAGFASCDSVRPGVDCGPACGCGEPSWDDWRPIPWQVFNHGEYVGPARTQHVPEYRLRVDDELDFIYRLTRNESSEPYQLNVGDQIRVESLTDPNLDRDLVIQPDGSITLRLLGQIRAARRTVDELRKELEEKYTQFYKTPAITVTPLQVNTRLEDLRATVDGRFGSGGQTRSARVTPEGTVQLPGIGSVPAQGLTLDEIQREIEARYEAIVTGIEVTPVLTRRASRHVFVLGEVAQPGRYSLEGPTTVMQAIAMAGGWNFGGDLRQVVVFRRAEDWRLIATRLDIRGALLGKKPCPADEIFLRDSDLVMLPKSSVLLATDFIDLVFIRGIYGIVPNQGVSVSFNGDSVF